jgi:hypothetical protein
MKVNVGLEDKMLQIKTKQYTHGIAIRYFIFWAILSVVKSQDEKVKSQIMLEAGTKKKINVPEIFHW